MSKRNQIDKSSIQWFCQEYKNGRTVEEMAVDNGWSKQNVKRALAEGQLMYLSWYKTREEDREEAGKRAFSYKEKCKRRKTGSKI